MGKALRKAGSGGGGGQSGGAKTPAQPAPSTPSSGNPLLDAIKARGQALKQTSNKSTPQPPAKSASSASGPTDMKSVISAGRANLKKTTPKEPLAADTPSSQSSSSGFNTNMLSKSKAMTPRSDSATPTPKNLAKNDDDSDADWSSDDDSVNGKPPTPTAASKPPFKAPSKPPDMPAVLHPAKAQPADPKTNQHGKTETPQSKPHVDNTRKRPSAIQVGSKNKFNTDGNSSTQPSEAQADAGRQKQNVNGQRENTKRQAGSSSAREKETTLGPQLDPEATGGGVPLMQDMDAASLRQRIAALEKQLIRERLQVRQLQDKVRQARGDGGACGGSDPEKVYRRALKLIVRLVGKDTIENEMANHPGDTHGFLEAIRMRYRLQSPTAGSAQHGARFHPGSPQTTFKRTVQYPSPYSPARTNTTKRALHTPDRF